VLAGEGDLPGMAQLSARRILRMTLLGLTLSLLVALLLAGGAHAAGLAGQEAPQGASGDTSTEAPAGAASADPAAEEPAQAAPPAEAPASAQPEGPAVEVPVEVVQAPPVIEVPVEVKVEVPILEVPVEAAPVAPVVEAPVEVPSASPVVEAAEAVPVPPVAQENVKAQDETVTPRDSEGPSAASDGTSQVVASSITAEASAPLTSSASSIASASAGESQATTPSGSIPSLPSPSTQATEAHRAEAFACALSSMGGSLGGICSASSETSRLLPGPSFGLVEVANRSANETASAPSGNSHSPVAVATPPVNPAPSPAPSGASGAAAGGSGVAPVGFFNLSGLLRMGAPRAMRRLRLSFRPRTTACFALIPERPG
jgi:hypothetical protein